MDLITPESVEVIDKETDSKDTVLDEEKLTDEEDRCTDDDHYNWSWL